MRGENLMKKIILVVSAALALVSCSHKPDVDVVDSLVDFNFSEIKGTQVRITFTPQNDRCRYLFHVMPVQEFDKLRESKGEQEMMVQFLADISKKYDDMCAFYRELGASYIAGFEDMAVYFGETTMYFIGLQPSTDYYALAFCVDPFKREPCGLLHRQLFRTTEISPELSDMRMTYLIQDNGEQLYFYVKPTDPEERICRDPYLVDVVPDAILYAEPYNGNLEKYAYDWYMERADDVELLRLYMHSDIVREEAYVVDRDKEGEGYTIFGAPYNINNISTLFSLHFVYKKGMYTEKYRNDQKAD